MCEIHMCARISIEQSVMVSVLAMSLWGLWLRDWSRAAEFTNYGGLTTIDHWTIFLVLLKIG